MKSWRFVFLICMFTVQAFTQQDFRLRYRPGSPQQYQVFSAEDLKELAAHGANLENINVRLNAIDDNLKNIRGTLDHEVLPTIHVMDFFKWLFGAIILAAIAKAINLWFPRRPVTP